MTVAIARDVERWSHRTGVDVATRLEPMNAAIAAIGARITATQYFEAIERMQSWSRQVCAWWEDHDLLLLPTSPEPPVPLGTLVADAPDAGERMGRLVGFTVPWDATGQPAISLPLHRSDDGLPVGVQLVAAYGREDLLLRVGAQLESARPWAATLPPVHRVETLTSTPRTGRARCRRVTFGPGAHSPRTRTMDPSGRTRERHEHANPRGGRRFRARTAGGRVVREVRAPALDAEVVAVHAIETPVYAVPTMAYVPIPPLTEAERERLHDTIREGVVRRARARAGHLPGSCRQRGRRRR
ncbi:MAG: hypothetical protein KatS3mg010_1387 [Acidimicrobiia bacterium]|nr:MAG: hypothetical protein KatS3mg010_1387 [Acidimicrobiia bacterium]